MTNTIPSRDPEDPSASQNKVVATGRPVSWWRKVLKEWSTWFITVGLLVQTAPDFLPLVDSMLSPILREEHRSAISSALVLMGIVSRFVPQNVRIKVEGDSVK